MKNMKKYGEMAVQIHVSLNSPPDGSEWSASRYPRVTLGRKISRYPLVRRLGGVECQY
jgi:hypothetical protein